MTRGASTPLRSSLDRKSTRLNSSHVSISYAVFCLKKKKQESYIVLCDTHPASPRYFFYCSSHHRDLHSFPTRRSSDLEASLWGFVSDTSGAGIAGAAVKITNVETGAERSLMTDDAGRFNAPSLVVGRYEITASKPGFQTGARTAVTLVVGQREELNLTLHIGDVHQSVEVSAYSGIMAVPT